MSSTPIKILDLPDPSIADYYDRYLIIAYAVRLQVATSKMPLKLLITDFTHNPLVQNRYNWAPEFAGINLEHSQLFQVDVFPDKLRALELEYRNIVVDEQLLEGAEDLIAHKFCVVNVCVTLRKVNSFVLGRLVNISVLNGSVDLDSLGPAKLANLAALHDQMAARLSRLFIASNFRKALRVFPPRILAQLGPDPSSHSTTSNSGPSGSQPRQVSVKGEEYNYTQPASLEFDPRRLFDNDDALIEPQTHRNIYTLEQLNAIKLIPDNRLYRAKAYIAGSIPENLSFVCTKGYVAEGSKVTLTDPFLQHLELVLSDVEPGTGEKLLDSTNSISVYVLDEQLPEFFGLSGVESIYTKLGALNQRFQERRTRPVNLELYKQVVKKSLVVVWCVKNATLEEVV